MQGVGGVQRARGVQRADRCDGGQPAQGSQCADEEFERGFERLSAIRQCPRWPRMLSTVRRVPISRCAACCGAVCAHVKMLDEE